MKQPSVSVIIPTRDRHELLLAAISSALDQAADVEVIVVDDGSAPPIREYLAANTELSARAGNRLQVLANDGGGANAARNKGLFAAQAEFVIFLDSDDRLLPGKVARALSIFAGPKKVDAVFGYSWGRTERGGVDNQLFHRSADPLAFSLLPSAMLCHTEAIVWRKTCALETLWDERLRRWQDWDFLVRALSKGIAFAYRPVPGLGVPHP